MVNDVVSVQMVFFFVMCLFIFYRSSTAFCENKEINGRRLKVLLFPTFFFIRVIDDFNL
jgi:hypothetical protein